MLTRCVMVYRPGKKKSGKRWSVTPIFRRCLTLSCYVTLPGPYPAVKLALKYKPRPKIAEGFIPRTLDARVDARLSALLEAREAEGSLARALFTPDAPASGPADTNSHAGEQPEAGQSACASRHDSISGTGKSAADNKASGSGTFRQNNGAFRPAGHDRDR
ncbi:conjugal transfer protein TraD [Klebsiella pneumoniae]|uniref:Conjugal transfer protein TraD n=1 Tax=Klebsiella pneumoniae TaxID=573 RepID=A0A378CND4_KLEPN|nr:conjugal transfer protein TraD [Klebsiella pneumoniae]